MSACFAILAYEGIEPIDIGATFGVLSMAKRVDPSLDFFVNAREAGDFEMTHGLRLVAQHGFADTPFADVLIVLGGPGWEAASQDAETLDFIRERHAAGTTIASVCTGGMILAAAGLLTGRKATTKREILPGEKRPLDLLAGDPAVDAREARIVDEGDIVTGGGVSLGIDMTLYLLGRFCGDATRDETARILEYDRAYHANAAALPDLIRA